MTPQGTALKIVRGHGGAVGMEEISAAEEPFDMIHLSANRAEDLGNIARR